MRSEGFDLVKLLSRRRGLLSRLADSPTDSPRLVDELDASRATVYRAVDELEEAGLVTRGEDGYNLTQTGRLLFERFETFTDFVADIDRASDLLAMLPSQPPVAPAFVDGATVVEADQPDTHAPGTKLSSLIEASTRVRALAVAHTQERAIEVFHDHVVGEGHPLEVVLTTDFYEYLLSNEDPRIDTVIESEHFDALLVESVPFGLFLLEREDDGDANTKTTAALAVYDEDRLLRGVLVNDATEAVAWAERVYRTYRERAEPVVQ